MGVVWRNFPGSQQASPSHLFSLCLFCEVIFFSLVPSANIFFFFLAPRRVEMWATVGLLVASSALSGHCLLVENAYGTTGSSSNCQLTYEEIPTQKCTPEPAESCVIVDFPSEDVEYKRVCKDVTSVHCPTTRRSKREAEADPQWSAVPLASSAWPWASNTRFQPLFQFQNAVPARYPASSATFLYPGSYKPLATPQSVVALPLQQLTTTADLASTLPDSSINTEDNDDVDEVKCHSVTAEHCLNQPVKVQKTVKAKKCHSVTKVSCVPHVEKVPKTLCKPTSTVTRSQQKRPTYNPFAYGPNLSN